MSHHKGNDWLHKLKLCLSSFGLFRDKGRDLIPLAGTVERHMCHDRGRFIKSAGAIPLRIGIAARRSVK